MIRETPVMQRNEYCRLCSSSSLELVIALEPTPLANSLVTAEQLDVAEDRYPLDVFICRNCSHIQLLDVVDPEILFRDYAYVSGTSQLYVDYLKQYANDVIKVYGLIPVMMWIRWTFPRLRFDQLMTYAWAVLVPLALVNLLLTTVALKLL